MKGLEIKRGLQRARKRAVFWGMKTVLMKGILGMVMVSLMSQCSNKWAGGATGAAVGSAAGYGIGRAISRDGGGIGAVAGGVAGAAAGYALSGEKERENREEENGGYYDGE